MSEHELILIIVLGVTAAIGWLASALLTLGYSRALRPCSEPAALPANPPRIEVWMPVRNGGPELRTAVTNLLLMDYPNFTVRVVIDNAADPAVPIVEELQRGDARLRYEILDKSPRNRSLFNSSLVQFFDHISPECELIVSCCADMNLPSNYYRNQIAAMSDPNVGCTLGNRWYRPSAESWGSICRYLYNIGAVVPMWLLQVPWGGAIAVRPDDARRSGLVDAWQTGMVDDAPIASAIKRIGKRFAFVPQLTVLEDDPISVAACFNFMERQLLWTRLYHRCWPMVLVGALAIWAFSLAPWIVMFVSALNSRWTILASAAGILAGFWLGIAGLIGWMEGAARRIIASNGQRVPQWTPGTRLRVILSIIPAYWLFCAAALKAHFAKHVSWSNVTYEIRGPHEIHIVSDRNHRQPYL